MRGDVFHYHRFLPNRVEAPGAHLLREPAVLDAGRR